MIHVNEVKKAVTACRAEKRYEDLLNEVCSTVKIDHLEYEPGRVLREVDPIAFRTGMLDWLDSEGIEIDD